MIKSIKSVFKRELPEDNEAEDKKVWGQGQGNRGQSFGGYAQVLSKGIYLLNIKGFPH